MQLNIFQSICYEAYTVYGIGQGSAKVRYYRTATAKAVYRAAVFGNTVPLPIPGIGPIVITRKRGSFNDPPTFGSFSQPIRVRVT